MAQLIEAGDASGTKPPRMPWPQPRRFRATPAHVACKHLQGDGTTLLGIRYPHAVRHRISRNGEAAMAKEPKKLDELFHDTLKDIYFAEKKILSTLPKMAKAAQSEELKAAFEKHRGETEGQIERLEQVFAIIGEKPRGKTCAAIVGITDEGAEIMEEYKGSPALDAGLLAAAQAVEHYEISRYGTLRAWAEELGLNDAIEHGGVTALDEFF
jgi:ferritin-like metal-binding protein YciE